MSTQTIEKPAENHGVDPAGSQPKLKTGTKRTAKPPSKPVKSASPGSTGTNTSKNASKPTPVPTPKPPHFKYSPDRPDAKPDKFFAWWRDLDPVFQDRMLAYVYRLWPVIQVRSYDSKSPTGYSVTTQIDKVSGTTPIQNTDEMLHRYGTGDYLIRLNDQEVLRKTVCMCFVSVRDLLNHPPILDRKHLVWDDPQNKSYVEYLKSKGEYPGKSNDDDDEDDMPTVKTIEKLTDRFADSLERQTERAIDLAARASRTQHSTPDISADAMRTGLEIVNQSAMMGNALIEKATQKVSEIAGNQRDPLEQARVLAELARGMKGDDSGVRDLFMAAMQRNDALQSQISKLHEQNTQMLMNLMMQKREEEKQQETRRNPGGVLDSLEELTKAKDKIRELLGISDDDKPAKSEEPAWLRYMPLGLSILNTIGAAIVAATHNLAVAKTGAGSPITPQQLPQQNPAEAESLQPSGSEAQDGQQEAVKEFLERLREPLISSLNAGESGYDFAAKFIDYNGRLSYDYLKELGQDRIIALLSTYPPIWQVASRIPQQFSAFLNEFLSYDEIEEAEGQYAPAQTPDLSSTYGPASQPTGGSTPYPVQKARKGKGQQAAAAGKPPSPVS